ncbi:hypothetical protein EJ08DRAFT_464976 [Tothia fuscella]|uniref:BRCT domain-containing protein n=1 Tax=Tothia fuscella TaxID=1048955 RepID=A0A9P4NXT1_9PEZI|nr:hypothetical protein EJ08DRAFT_464976 [Tothia fuscella]
MATFIEDFRREDKKRYDYVPEVRQERLSQNSNRHTNYQKTAYLTDGSSEDNVSDPRADNHHHLNRNADRSGKGRPHRSMTPHAYPSASKLKTRQSSLTSNPQHHFHQDKEPMSSRPSQLASEHLLARHCYASEGETMHEIRAKRPGSPIEQQCYYSKQQKRRGHTTSTRPECIDLTSEDSSPAPKQFPGRHSFGDGPVEFRNSISAGSDDIAATSSRIRQSSRPLDSKEVLNRSERAHAGMVNGRQHHKLNHVSGKGYQRSRYEVENVEMEGLDNDYRRASSHSRNRGSHGSKRPQQALGFLSDGQSSKQRTSTLPFYEDEFGDSENDDNSGNMTHETSSRVDSPIRNSKTYGEVKPDEHGRSHGIGSTNVNEWVASQQMLPSTERAPPKIQQANNALAKSKAEVILSIRAMAEAARARNRDLTKLPPSPATTSSQGTLHSSPSPIAYHQQSLSARKDGRSRQAENGKAENASAQQKHFNAYDPPMGMLRSHPRPAPSRVPSAIMVSSESEAEASEDESPRSVKVSAGDIQLDEPAPVDHHTGQNADSPAQSNPISDVAPADKCLEGFHFTSAGQLPCLDRNEIKALVVKYGGSWHSSITNKTTHVVVGKVPAQKIASIQARNIDTLDESGFFEMIETFSSGRITTAELHMATEYYANVKPKLSQKGAFRPPSGSSTEVQSSKAVADPRVLSSEMKQNGTTEATPTIQKERVINTDTKVNDKSNQPPVLAKPSSMSQSTPTAINIDAELRQQELKNAELEAQTAAVKAKLIEHDPELQETRRQEEELAQKLRESELTLQMEKAKVAQIEESKRRQAKLEAEKRALDAQHEKFLQQETVRLAEEEKKKAEEASKKAELERLKKKEFEEAKAKRQQQQLELRKQQAELKFKKAQQEAVNVAQMPPWADTLQKPRSKSIGLGEKDLKEISKVAKASKKSQAQEERKQKLDEELAKYPMQENVQAAKILKRPTPRKRKSDTQKRHTTSPPNGQIVGPFVETESESNPESDQETLFVSEEKEPALTPAPQATPRSKPKKKIAPTTTSVQSIIQPAPAQPRPTTGGKYINPEALRAYIETLSDEEVSVYEEEPEVEAAPIERERECSPMTTEDCYHWVYQVKRRNWQAHEIEDEAEWIVSGSKICYTSLQQANTEAGLEVQRYREGLALGPEALQYIYNSFNQDMAEYYVQQPTGSVRVKVDRFLRNRLSKQLPPSKAGWIRKTGWDIMLKTVTKTTIAAEDVCFDEDDVTVDEKVEVVDGVFTIMDEANREAGAYVLEMTTKKDSNRIDDIQQRSEQEKNISATLNALEREKDIFRAEWNLTFEEEEKIIETTMEVYVQQRLIKGPRNI